MNASTTLCKWGNSQGFRLSKEICDLLGIELGAEAKISVDAAKSEVTLAFEAPKRKYHRARKVSIEGLFEGHQGDYEPPSDYPLLGNEIDWGQPAGNEVLQ